VSEELRLLLRTDAYCVVADVLHDLLLRAVERQGVNEEPNPCAQCEHRAESPLWCAEHCPFD